LGTGIGAGREGREGREWKGRKKAITQSHKPPPWPWLTRMSDKHEMRFSRIFTGVNLEGYYANGRIN
jgi:hypothetical protein